MLWDAKWENRSCLWILMLWVLFSHSGPTLRAGTSSHPESISCDRRATLAIQALQSWYDEDTGLYRTTGWWNTANAITVLADYSRITGSRKYESVFLNTLSAAQKTYPGFINQFYDDEGWWALAWIDVYGVTLDQRYLAVAKSIFADMTGAWDRTCSGGIWWSKDRKYKNAIANELFLAVAAQLATRTADQLERAGYLVWAEKEWHWFSQSGMINASHLVNAGLNDSCANNRQTTWSYNQGVIAGALVDLYKADRDPTLLSDAGMIAEAALSSMTDARGILHDPCEPDCGADGTQFKGIFVRNLRTLDEIEPRPRYERFAFTNADSIWAQVHSPDYHLGEVWAKPFGVSNASTQSSALDALVTAAEMWRTASKSEARPALPAIFPK